MNWQRPISNGGQKSGTELNLSLKKVGLDKKSRDRILELMDLQSAKMTFFRAAQLFVVRNTTPPMPAPGAVVRCFRGVTSTNGMPATSSRNHSPANTRARHRAVRRATASASAKMLRRLCILGVMTRPEVHRLRTRRHHLCRRQAPLHGASGATHPQIKRP